MGERRLHRVGSGQPELGPATLPPSAHRVPPGLPLCLSERESGCPESPLLQQRCQCPVSREGRKLCGIRVPHFVFSQTNRRRHGQKRCGVVCCSGRKNGFGKTLPDGSDPRRRVDEGRRLVYLSSSSDAASPKKAKLLCFDVKLAQGTRQWRPAFPRLQRRSTPSSIAWPESCRRPPPARTFLPGSILSAKGFPHRDGADHFSTPSQNPTF